jgi:hypothetical protein
VDTFSYFLNTEAVEIKAHICKSKQDGFLGLAGYESTSRKGLPLLVQLLRSTKTEEVLAIDISFVKIIGMRCFNGIEQTEFARIYRVLPRIFDLDINDDLIFLFLIVIAGIEIVLIYSLLKVDSRTV